MTPSHRSRLCGSAAVAVTLLKSQFSDRGPGPSGVREPPPGAATGGLRVPGAGPSRGAGPVRGRALIRGRTLVGGVSSSGGGPSRGWGLSGGGPSSGGGSSWGACPRGGVGPRGGGSQVRWSPDFADRPGQRPGGDAVCQAVGAGRPRCPRTADRRRAARERQGGGKLSLQKPVTQRSTRSSSAQSCPVTAEPGSASARPARRSSCAAWPCLREAPAF